MFLTKDGALKNVSNPDLIELLKSQGWVEEGTEAKVAEEPKKAKGHPKKGE